MSLCGHHWDATGEWCLDCKANRSHTEISSLKLKLGRLQLIIAADTMALDACKRELLLYAGAPEDHDEGTAEALALCEAAQKAREL